MVKDELIGTPKVHDKTWIYLFFFRISCRRTYLCNCLNFCQFANWQKRNLYYFEVYKDKREWGNENKYFEICGVIVSRFSSQCCIFFAIVTALRYHEMLPTLCSTGILVRQRTNEIFNSWPSKLDERSRLFYLYCDRYFTLSRAAVFRLILVNFELKRAHLHSAI